MKIKKTLLKIFRKLVKPIAPLGLGRFYLIRKLHNFLIYFLSPIEINGYKMFLEPSDGLDLLIRPSHEQYETEVFKKEIKEGDIVLDLGAHIGYYALLASKLVGEKGKVFAIEPDPTNFALLKKNIEINNFHNVAPFQKAVSDVNGKGKLYMKKKKTQNRIYDSQDKDPFIEIETARLDDLIKGDINFIKMDVEGSEAMAVRGMIDILKKNQRIKMITEFYPDLIKKSGENPLEFLKLLRKCGFSINEINEQTRKVEPVDFLEKISEIEGHTNLFCIK